MRMRGWITRGMRLVFVALVAWLSFQWLSPQGLGWVVLLAAALLVALWMGYRVMSHRRRRSEDARADRLAEALMVPPKRAAALRELEGELAALDAGKPRHAARRASLSLMLAELLEADGKPERALSVLDRVGEARLSKRTRVVLAHARAVSWLSAGNPERAAEVLADVPRTSGDRAVDLRVRMMHGLIAAERGDVAAALERAEEASAEAGSDRDLKVEAQVLEAVARDAAGDHQEALKVMRGIGHEMIEVLAMLGLPRVRRLAAEVLERRGEERVPSDASID